MITLAQLADYFLEQSETDPDPDLRPLWATLAAEVDAHMASHGPKDDVLPGLAP